MAANLIIWEAANLFAGDDASDNSKHLTIQNIQLWQPKEKTKEHHAGGSIGAMMIGGLGFEAPEVTFKLMGVDAQTKALFGLGGNGTRPYTIYGALRNKNGGALIERKVVCMGRLIEVGESAYERGNVVDQDHKISEITHYELWEDKREVMYYDWPSSTWRVNGLNQLAEINSILRIP